MNAQESTTTRPYLIRALHEWCTDNGFTPYLAVRVDDSVQVPREYVKDGEIVLNVGLDATSGLLLGNDFIEFKARFGGKARDIMVPVSRVLAIMRVKMVKVWPFLHPQICSLLWMSPVAGAHRRWSQTLWVRQSDQWMKSASCSWCPPIQRPMMVAIHPARHQRLVLSDQH